MRGAMGGAQARRLCPGAVVVPPRMSAYSEASKAVFEVFEDTAPLVEGLSIDEAFLDVRGLGHISRPTGRDRGAAAPEGARPVGLPITVGVAGPVRPGRRRGGQPSGLLIVPPGRRAGLPPSASVRRLWGVGAVTDRKLNERGITTVGQGVARLAETTLVSMLGRASGRHIHALAHNRDPSSRPGPPPASLDGSAATLGRGPRSPA